MISVCQVPVRFCGQGCESHEGPEECRERETDVLHDVPGQSSLFPLKFKIDTSQEET